MALTQMLQPDTLLRVYTAAKCDYGRGSSDPLADFKGAVSRRGRRKGERREGGKEREGVEKKGMGGKSEQGHRMAKALSWVTILTMHSC